MEAHPKYDWQKEALDFFVNLYPVKQEKELATIRRKLTDLLLQHTHASAVASIKLEDDITARVAYATDDTITGFVNAEIIVETIAKDEITYCDGVDFLYRSNTIAILLPVNAGIYIGASILYIDKSFELTDDFRQLLQHVWIGLKGITMLMQSYYAIEELTIRFNAILGTVNEGIVFVDDTGKDGWVNAAASELLGIARDRNSSTTIAAAMQKLRVLANNSEDIAKRGTMLFSSPNQTIKDWKWIYGNPVSKVLSVACTPTISDNIKGRLWVFTDITETYLLNEELAEKRKLADEQNQAKSDFLANMSHEIRTPMNGVIGMTSLLANTPLNDEQKDYLDTIRISGESLLAIINDILDFSKIESGKMNMEAHPFRISTVIEETYDLLSVKANEKGLDLLYLLDPDIPNEIIGDITRFRQILINLVSNALKFTEKGEIFISANNLGVNEGIFTLQFTVKDTGIGIPEDKYHKLFESFSQVDSSTTRKYGGTGLGLAICHRLVKLMGGNIRVESEPGKGSSFIFTIQASANKQKKRYITKEKADTGVLKDKSVLILDDNITNLKILNKQCELWGMKAVVCNNYKAAITQLKYEQFDAAIIDMLMPDANGIEVATLIKRQKPMLPIILFSSAGYLSLGDAQIKELFAAVINKPVKHSQMEEILIDVLGKYPDRDRQIIVNVPTDANALPINILVAEDDEINQKMIRRALEKLGYTFDLVANGKLSVEAANKKQYELIFMDV
ncbi:MAG: ATP-binding protein, partial [Flavipsychrobacter sp.]